MSAHESDKGIKVVAASGGVDETMDRLESLAKKRGLTVFARINFAKDAANHCWITFNSPEYLQKRHGFPAALLANIAGLEKLVQAAIASGQD